LRFSRGLWFLLLGLTLGLGFTARASAQVPGPGTSDSAKNLLIDVERIVTSTEGSGWFLDEDAFRGIYSTLLESVCRASESARREALDRAEESARAAGEPHRVFEREGSRVTPAVSRSLSAHRQWTALERAVTGAEKDCPFWVRAGPEFSSRQTDGRRWTFAVETGGNIQLRQTAGRWTFGGGGLGRVLPSYGLTPHVSLLFGLEFGGGAMLRPGGPTTEFVINYFPAIPFVIRIRDVNWHYDLEAGPVALFQADNTQLSYGARLGATIGVYALRTRNLIPWAGLATTYEYYFPGGDRPHAYFLRGGLRVGLLWDP
jgi:hypothetical protein